MASSYVSDSTLKNRAVLWGSAAEGISSINVRQCGGPRLLGDADPTAAPRGAGRVFNFVFSGVLQLLYSLVSWHSWGQKERKDHYMFVERFSGHCDFV